MKRVHTYTSISKEKSRDKRTVQGWCDKARRDGHELGEIINGARMFSDEERTLILTYAGAATEFHIKDDEEVAIATTTELLLPEDFSPRAMIAHFDGAVGEATNPDQIVALTRAIVNAGLTTLNAKVERQKATLVEHQQALIEATQIASEGFVDLKIKASESRIVAEQQTAATQQLQSLMGKLAALGQTNPS